MYNISKATKGGITPYYLRMSTKRVELECYSHWRILGNCRVWTWRRDTYRECCTLSYQQDRCLRSWSTHKYRTH